jgi:hypothetical protein
MRGRPSHPSCQLCRWPPMRCHPGGCSLGCMPRCRCCRTVWSRSSSRLCCLLRRSQRKGTHWVGQCRLYRSSSNSSSSSSNVSLAELHVNLCCVIEYRAGLIQAPCCLSYMLHETEVVYRGIKDLQRDRLHVQHNRRSSTAAQNQSDRTTQSTLLIRTTSTPTLLEV